MAEEDITDSYVPSDDQKLQRIASGGAQALQHNNFALADAIVTIAKVILDDKKKAKKSRHTTSHRKSGGPSPFSQQTRTRGGSLQVKL